MNAASSYAVTERPLESLGISAPEECAYVALLDHPEATLAELSSALAWPTRKVQRLLDALQGMGLVTFAAGEPRRFVPASPDIAIEATCRGARMSCVAHARSWNDCSGAPPRVPASAGR